MSRGRRGGGNRGSVDVTLRSHVGACVELAPQPLCSPRDAHLRRGLVASDEPGDLEMRPLDDEAQVEDAAVLGRQTLERLCEARCDGSILTNGLLEGQYAPAAPAQLVGDAA